MKKVLVIFISIIFVIFSVVLFIYFSFIKCDVNSDKYTQNTDIFNVSNKYSSFVDNSEKYTVIPGLSEKIVPQGLDYNSKYNYMFISAYHYGEASSLLFVIDFNSGKLIKTLVLENLNIHAGGVTSNEEFIWITDEYKIYKYKLDDVVNLSDMSNLVYEDVFDMDIKSDYITYHNDILWVGEYNYGFIFSTKEEHYISVSNDKMNKSLLVGYDINNLEIKYVLSVPDRIQGLAFDNDDNFIFSKSFWSFQSSRISKYKNILNQEGKEFDFYGKKVNLLVLSDNEKISSIEIPPMAEEIVYLDDYVYINFESSANLYKFYTFNKIGYIMKMKY